MEKDCYNIARQISNKSSINMVSKLKIPPQQHCINSQSKSRKGSLKKQPPGRKIIVPLGLSEAFDTDKIHNLLLKLQQTNKPNLVKKFEANYIKGRKGYTLYQDAQSKQQQFKPGVPQGGVLSPTLCNL